jgi:hypothetical protein
MANPVGTGPFKLKEWRRAQRIVLEANQNYREEFFPALPPNADAEAKAAYAAMKGKRLPQVGRVEVAVIEESNPRLLAFNSNELDLVDVPRDLVTRVLDDKNRLQSSYAKQGVTLQRAEEAGLAFFAYFNMNDSVVGGYTAEKVALRRALLMGYSPGELISVGLQGQGAVATQPIPPEVPGHVPGLKNPTPHDPALARALLDKFGYRDRNGDGFRELPDGKPLVLSMGSAPTGENRIRDELWLKNMRDIGVKVEFAHQKWPDLIKMARAGQLQMWQVGWTATSADSYMELAYGPNGGQSNLSFLQERRVRQPAQGVASPPHRCRAQQALCAHDRDRRRLRADGRWHLPHREHDRQAVDRRLQEGQLPLAAVAVHRCRQCAHESGAVEIGTVPITRPVPIFPPHCHVSRAPRTIRFVFHFNVSAQRHEPPLEHEALSRAFHCARGFAFAVAIRRRHVRSEVSAPTGCPAG